MERETAQVVGERGESRGTRSPFIVWEGGREYATQDGALQDVSTDLPAGDGLSLAMESPHLPVPGFVDADMGRLSNQGSAMALPSPQVPPVRHHAVRSVGAMGSGTLDWHLIWMSLLLFIAMTLGAIVVRGSQLDAAYGSLQWEEHRVMAGETLDSILAERDLPDVGAGRLADWVEKRNGLQSSAIVPGQVLSVPR